MALTPEDIASISEALKPIIVETASQAAAAHVTKRNAAIKSEVSEALEGFKANFVKQPEEETPEKVTLTKRMEQLEADNRKLREESRQKDESIKNKAMRDSLQEHLLKAGVPQPQLKAVVAQLIHEDKLVNFDKEGKPVFKVAGYNNETVPLEDGVSEWVKGDGKVFIPDPTARGAGMKTQKSSAPNDPGMSQQEQDLYWMNRIRRGN